MINSTFNQSTTPSNNHGTTDTATPATPTARTQSPTAGSFSSWTDDPAPVQPNNSKAILFGAIIVAGALFAIGFLTRGTAQPAQATAAPVGNYFTEQQQMMREAMDMAREAREAHREHMQMMRQLWEQQEAT